LVPVRERENRPGDAEEALQTTILDQANLMARHGRCEGKDLMKHAAQFVARQPPKPPLPAEESELESLGEAIYRELNQLAAVQTAEQMVAWQEIRSQSGQQPK